MNLDKRALDVVFTVYECRVAVYRKPYHHGDLMWSQRYFVNNALKMADTDGSLVKRALDDFQAGDYDAVQQTIDLAGR